MSAPTTSAAPVTATPATAAQPAASAKTPEAAPAKAAVAAERMFKLKVDGQEIELPESEVLSRASKVSAADKRFQEGATTRKQAEQIIRFAQENPAEFFSKTGKNARQWAEDYLLEQIKRDEMSPEQKKAWENEQKLKDYEKQEKDSKEKAHADKMQALEREQMQSYDDMFTAALSESGLPKTAYTVKRMAELTLVNVKKKLDLSPSQLAKLVREDYIAEQKALYGNADGDTLMELLGKEGVKRLSKAQIAKYKAGKKNVTTTPKNDSGQSDQTENPNSAWKAMRKKTRSLM